MRHFKNIQTKRALLILIIIISYITPVFSCSTPVFRYALEMWPAYSYIVEVIHDRNLNSSQQQALEYLKTSSTSETPVNLRVIETVVNQSNDAKKEDLPIIRLFFPKEFKIAGVGWQGKLTEENVKNIVDSPSRRQVLKNIQKGDAAVWLFLESGNTERDSKQLKILKEELRLLSKKLKLAESATDVSGKPLDIEVINTGVTFSLVQINRNDPAEEIFIELLLGTEADLKLFKNVPLAFPVFGQGRALYALAGNGIKYKNIETACNAIIGWCSCTIKDDNPGTDLLFKADWNIAIGDTSWIQTEEVPDITGLYEFVSIEEKIVVEVKEDPESKINDFKENEELIVENKNILSSKVNVEEQRSVMNPLLRNSLFAIVLLLVVITTALFVLKRK